MTYWQCVAFPDRLKIFNPHTIVEISLDTLTNVEGDKYRHRYTILAESPHRRYILHVGHDEAQSKEMFEYYLEEMRKIWHHE